MGISRVLFIFVGVFVLILHTLSSAHGAFGEQQLLRQGAGGIPDSIEIFDRFGSTLATGDFNGDGLQDLAIGVPSENIGSVTNAGMVHVVYGTLFGLSGDQAWHMGMFAILGAAEEGDSYGSSLAVGDFDNDGYSDLAIGVPHKDVSGMAEAGLVNVLYGSPAGLGAAGNQIWHLNVEGMQGDPEEGDGYGFSLAAGDCNGDSYDDLAVGIPFRDVGNVRDAGQVSIITGSLTGLTSTNNLVLHQGWFFTNGLTREARFGSSLTIGDCNGDGYKDLAVGIPFSNRGEVYLLYGEDTIIPGQLNYDVFSPQLMWWYADEPLVTDYDAGFGSSLTMGDFNGDGYKDLAVGDPRRDAGAEDSGGVCVGYGSSEGLVDEQFWHQGVADIIGTPSDGDGFGASLSSGDCNADGYHDLLVGVPGKDISGQDTGMVNIIYGSSTGLNNEPGNRAVHQNTTGVEDASEAGDEFGYSLAAADFNGDGWDDLAIGVPGEQFASGTLKNVDNGMVHVFLSSGLSALVYPHVDITTPWTTEVCAINKSSHSMSGTFTAYDENGSMVGRRREISIPAFGRTALDVSLAFIPLVWTGEPRVLTEIKYVIFTHDEEDGDACGYTKFSRAGHYRGALPASKVPASGNLYVPHIASDPNWWTGIGLVNLTGLTKNLNLSCSGAPSRSMSIPRFGQSSFLVRSLYDNVPQPSLASAVIEGSKGLVGLELFGRGDQMAGIRLMDKGATTLYFPHVHADTTWWTGLVVFNPGLFDTTLTITPYNAGGDALPLQTVSVASRSKYVGFARNLGLPVDTAWLKVTSSRPVTGFELFGTWDQKLLAGFTAVDLVRHSGMFPKVEPGGWTGLALVNTTESPITVTFTAYDPSGSQVATSSLSLDGHAKRVAHVSDLFGADISTATHVGFTATGEVAGFQLNGSDDGWLLDGLPGM